LPISPSKPNVIVVAVSSMSRDGERSSNTLLYGKLARTPGPATTSSMRCRSEAGMYGFSAKIVIPQPGAMPVGEGKVVFSCTPCMTWMYPVLSSAKSCL